MKRHALAIVSLAFLFACGGRTAVDGHADSGGGGGAAGGDAVGIVVGGGFAGLNAGGSSSSSGAGTVGQGAGQAMSGCSAIGSCPITAEDVACDDDASCTLLSAPDCGSLIHVIGVNRAAKVACVAPPCAPPGPRPSPPPDVDASCIDCTSYESQDCEITPDSHSIVAHCIDHRCRSSLGGCNPCDVK